MKMSLMLVFVASTIALLSIWPASASGFAETINLDSIGVAAGIAIDNDRNFAGTLALAPNGMMDADVSAAVGANGGSVSQETIASGAEVFAGSMAGDLDDAAGCILSTTSQAYTDVQVTNGGFNTLQGADTITDLNAYQVGTLAIGDDVSTNTYAENENGYNWADSRITDGSILLGTYAFSSDVNTYTQSYNDMDGWDGFMNDGSVIYDGPHADSQAWYDGYGTMTGTAWAWQDDATAAAWIL